MALRVEVDSHFYNRQTYAIPTNFMSVEEDFEPFVQNFIEYAKAHPDNRFILPRMECKGAVFYEKVFMARYTPNFDKEEWKYEALAEMGAEFHWEK